MGLPCSFSYWVWIVSCYRSCLKFHLLSFWVQWFGLGDSDVIVLTVLGLVVWSVALQCDESDSWFLGVPLSFSVLINQLFSRFTETEGLCSFVFWIFMDLLMALCWNGSQGMRHEADAVIMSLMQTLGGDVWWLETSMLLMIRLLP
jgi:hypothetical protein